LQIYHKRRVCGGAGEADTAGQGKHCLQPHRQVEFVGEQEKLTLQDRASMAFNLIDR